uniref:Uncharacterized protein n=1 Tax=Plectus sambesii TaxID=2011161 RepID=A0A914UYD7_9BILA
RDPNIRGAFSHSHVNNLKSSPRRRTGSIQTRPDSQVNGARKRNETFSESTGYLKIKDVFYSGSVTHIPEFVAHHDVYRSIASLGSAHVGSLHAGSVSHVGDRIEVVTPAVVEEKEGGCLSTSVLKNMIDFSLLVDPIFLLFAVSNFLTSIGFNAPLVFLPDRAELELGIPRDKASWILSSFGIANTIGRVCIGFVCDREWAVSWGKDAARNRLWVYNISVTICGACTMLSFLCSDLITLIIYAAVFGFTLSSYVCLTSVLLVDLLGLERLTNA